MAHWADATQQKSKLGAFVAPDGSAKIGEAGDSRAFVPVVEPAFGGERGELGRVCYRGHLPPVSHPPDLRFGGKRQFDGAELTHGFDVKGDWLHAFA